ncbi:MAG: recombination protein RecR [Elusimicrobia bacterium]|nr:recombination protein RecR [Elusimicrobiota bacterium]
MTKSLQRLIAAFRKFPGVGPKQAERFAMLVIMSDSNEVREFIQAIESARNSIKLCRFCCDLSEEEICSICSDTGRNRAIICVVEQPQDAAAVEKTGAYNGLYHVLHGAISPIEGVNSGSIKLQNLAERIRKSNGAISEIIIATNPDTEGEMTAMHITRLLKNKVAKITRIAYGVPLGGDIDYIDEMTLRHALNGRISI